VLACGLRLDGWWEWGDRRGLRSFRRNGLRVLQQNVTVNTRSLDLSGIITLAFEANLPCEVFWSLFGRSAVRLICRTFQSIRLLGWICGKFSIYRLGNIRKASTYLTL
jgi:hypothetical protein